MHIDDIQLDTEVIQMKLRALSNQAYDRMESVENSVEQKWVKDDTTLTAYLKERIEDLYIITTLVNDIQRSVDKLNVDVTKLSNKLNNASNVIPDQEPTLPANNE
ncbi:hypothetical protein [Macrococcus armenti]|uniref:hypothetical protein n=1 Tax=Macrococcus armenti TaxID=2875764 RepID=UPI001CCB0AB7|nr:hypothetical protein [Macrococcus armenti]UBH09499.1 hypothetical protein LAU41_04805 [Macrococcus armenti]